MKITTEELTNAYIKANEFRKNGIPTRRSVKVEVERNPLTHQESFDSDEEFSTPFKLEFKLFKDIGRRGSYILVTDVEIIDDEC